MLCYASRLCDGICTFTSMRVLQVTRELGLHLTSPEESIVDMVATMVAEGIVQPKMA